MELIFSQRWANGALALWPIPFTRERPWLMLLNANDLHIILSPLDLLRKPMVGHQLKNSVVLEEVS